MTIFFFLVFFQVLLVQNAGSSLHLMCLSFSLFDQSFFLVEECQLKLAVRVLTSSAAWSHDQFVVDLSPLIKLWTDSSGSS